MKKLIGTAVLIGAVFTAGMGVQFRFGTSLENIELIPEVIERLEVAEARQDKADEQRDSALCLAQLTVAVLIDDTDLTSDEARTRCP